MNPYLSFTNGGCKAAFELYQRVLDAKLMFSHTYAQSPAPEHAPDGNGEAIMHATLQFPNGQLLMGSDVSAEHAKPFGGFSLSVNAKSTEEAERVFAGLSEGGQVTMPLEKTFWAERFGMCVDAYGVAWMVNFEMRAEA